MMTGLEALRTKIGPLVGEMEIGEDGLPHYFVTGKRAEYYKAIEKELKAFDIIKRKRVNTARLIDCFAYDDLVCTTGLIEYNGSVYETNSDELSQEEYDSLKEALL